MPTWEECVKTPFMHPAYLDYQSQCKNKGFPREFIRSTWQCMIRGLQEAVELKRRGAIDEPNLSLIEFDNIIGTYRDDILLPPQQNSNIKLALWSGGYDLSQRARRQGFQTLESTIYGAILDKMTYPRYKIWRGSDNWGPQGQIWNILSRHFLSVATPRYNKMDIFMRTHDPDSVLYREELITWHNEKGKRFNERAGLTYHICIGDGSLGITEKLFYTDEDAVRYLRTILDSMRADMDGKICNIGDMKFNPRQRSQLLADHSRSIAGTFGTDPSSTQAKYPYRPDPNATRDYREAKDKLPKSDGKAFAEMMAELLKTQTKVE